MSEPAPIPVTVIAGFLGAGKTTLLNHILSVEHGRRIGVLVNDFGSINVDAELVTDVSDEMISLANGCICCTIRMDLIQSVLEMADRDDRPEHIVIESSGIADPAGVVKSFLEPEIWGAVQFDAVITVVDAEQALDLAAEEARLARAQIAGGDLILLNKIDLVDAEQLARVHDWINRIRPGAQVFETTRAQVPMEILLGAGPASTTDRGGRTARELEVHVHDVSTGDDHGDGDGDGDGDEAHVHELSFDTWTYTSATPLQMMLFQELLRHLPTTVFRAKGFVDAVEQPGDRLVVQLVGRRATVTSTGPWGDQQPRTRLVFISRRGTVSYPALEKALDNCRVET